MANIVKLQKSYYVQLPSVYLKMGLSDGALVLLMYLFDQNMSTYKFIQKNIADSLSVNVKTIERRFKELKEKGIVEIERTEKDYVYTFNDVLVSDVKTKPKPKPKEEVKTEYITMFDPFTDKNIQKVKLTQEQYDKLYERYGPKLDQKILDIDRWCYNKKKSYTDYNLTVHQWFATDKAKETTIQNKKGNAKSIKDMASGINFNE